MFDLKKLAEVGKRTRKVRVFEVVTDPRTGFKDQQFVNKIEEYQTNQLTPEEASILKDEPWVKCDIPDHPKFMCLAGGRWFCDIDPSAKATKPATFDPEAPKVYRVKNTKGTVLKKFTGPDGEAEAEAFVVAHPKRNQLVVEGT